MATPVSRQVSVPTPPDLVSVIIPVHNRFDLAARAIRSVVTQTYRPIEIIVVDDASDEPFVFPREPQMAGLECDVVRLESNGGPGAAREAGRNRARGGFIAYLDSDDWWTPDFLTEMTGALQRNASAGMAYCAAAYADSGETPEYVKRSNEPFNRFLPTALWGRPWPTAGCLWQKWATDKIGPWLPLWWWEDYEYDCRAGRLGITICQAPAVLCIVQRDAPKRISQVLDPARAVESLGRAAGEISRYVAELGMLEDPKVRSRVAEMLLGVAVAALEISRFKIATANIHLARRRSGPIGSCWLWTLPTLLSVQMRNRALALKFTRRFRTHLVSRLNRQASVRQELLAKN
jgi:hypothetical protein